MTISVGDKVPAGTLAFLGDKGPEVINTDDIFSGKKVVLFAVPGAFTPTCSEAHLPGFVANQDKIIAKGVDQVVCRRQRPVCNGCLGKNTKCRKAFNGGRR